MSQQVGWRRNAAGDLDLLSIMKLCLTLHDQKPVYVRNVIHKKVNLTQVKEEQVAVVYSGVRKPVFLEGEA